MNPQITPEANAARPEPSIFDDNTLADAALREKLIDAAIPGYQAEFDPEEAERVGAFVENALSERDAVESANDLVEIEGGHGSKG